MYKLGWSVFVSQFDSVKDRLPLLYTKGARVFTSLHIAEEFNSDYKKHAETLCSSLANWGYEIIADISKRTLEVFNEGNPVKLAKKLHLSVLRLDYGFSSEETAEIAQSIPLCLNASTLDTKTIIDLKKGAMQIYAMHNYYPRPETGLDTLLFDRINRNLAEHGIEVFSFIPGDSALRAPLYAGLPTLEKHRGAAPFAAYADSLFSHTVSGIFVGDGIISEKEAAHISAFAETGILDIPVILSRSYVHLNGKVFTVRSDSPAQLIRLQESREYATQGAIVPPKNTAARPLGAITIDNEKYLRYSGEIQIMRQDYPADERVNVIGHVPASYRLLLPAAENGKKIRLCLQKTGEVP